MNITEAGIDLVLYHAPGETNDQIIVHWPEQDVLCPADNIYRAFPNLYAVRGTAARYSCNNITTTLIQISRLFYFGFFSKTNHQMII